MKYTLLILSIAIGLAAHAGQKYKINMNASDLTVNTVTNIKGAFTKINIAGFKSDRTVGAPELPVKSWLVIGTPEQIQVKFQPQTISDVAGKPFPVQEQDCRCATDKVKTFKINNELYSKTLDSVSIHYLGDFRGTPVSQVNVRLGTYLADKKKVQLVTSAEVELNAPEFSLPRGDYRDYLIITTAPFAAGITEFADWKRAKGFNVSIEVVNNPTTSSIQNLVKQYYTEKGVDFVILVGSETSIPMFKVDTAGSAQTPSDLQYFTMDGPQDHIPDIFSSRIVASSADQVRVQLAKSIEFEKRSYQNAVGLKNFIGIASNEGSAPSDDEYVKSIENKFKDVLGANISHFHQNDYANSKPSVLNSSFNNGALWLTYLGHGNGTSWPSMAQSYSVTNVSQIDNQPSVKPIIIDVACQNGRLVNNYLGTSFMKAEALPNNNPFGASAYYGGSVNIAWHPPAIMARGIAFEHLANKYHFLGETLLAGHLYLAANWNNQEDIVDNLEWYHLQGDPGMDIQF